MLQSHTATQQWQSFEMRMRRRRVERCLLRATAAIETGVLDDAREAIDEIRRLDPNEPGLEELTAQLAEAENPSPIEQVPLAAPAPQNAPAGSHRLAAAIVLFAAAVAGGWWWTSTFSTMPAPIQPATTTAPLTDRPAADALPDPSVRVSVLPVAAPISAEPLPNGDVPMATSGLAAIESQRPRPDVNAAEGIEVPPSPVATDASARVATPDPAPDSTANARNEQRPALVESRSGALVASPVVEPPPIAPPPPAPSPRLEPLPGLPETAPASPRVVTGAEEISTAETAVRTGAALAALPSAPGPDAASARAEEQSVRAALGRYESAYNRLDAAAAASVWPGVNQRALASAFQGLSAQSISLGGCAIRVSGPTAHAECSGNARWTPKVGAGTQSAQRQWRFDLRNSGGTWLITQATTR